MRRLNTGEVELARSERRELGSRLVNDHDETQTAQEELYVVLDGTAVFTAGDEEIRVDGGENRVTTWSPGATLVTPSPTASTTPAPSCPSTVGA